MSEALKFPEVVTKLAFGYDEAEHETTTFIGGTPYINEGFEFPKDEEGNILRFFCQIDLSNVDEQVKEMLYLPASGFLQFYHGNDDVFGMDFDNTDYSDNVSRILYLEEAFDDDSLSVPDYGDYPEDSTPIYPTAGKERVYYAGKLVELLPYPNSIDNPALAEDGRMIDEELFDDYTNYYDFVNEAGYELYLGGYPHFTQSDIREGGMNDHLSLLLGSESGSQIVWGDVGTGGFWVPKEDLKKQDYSKSVIYWDCY